MKKAGWIIILLTAWSTAFAGKYDAISKYPIVPFGISEAEVKDKLIEKGIFSSYILISGINFSVSYYYNKGLLDRIWLHAFLDKNTTLQSLQYIYSQFKKSISQENIHYTNQIMKVNEIIIESDSYYSKNKKYLIQSEYSYSPENQSIQFDFYTTNQ